MHNFIVNTVCISRYVKHGILTRSKKNPLKCHLNMLNKHQYRRHKSFPFNFANQTCSYLHRKKPRAGCAGSHHSQLRRDWNALPCGAEDAAKTTREGSGGWDKLHSLSSSAEWSRRNSGPFGRGFTWLANERIGAETNDSCIVTSTRKDGYLSR